MRTSFVGFLLFTLIFTGCLLEQQKAEDIFVSGQLPNSLEKVANPKPVASGSLASGDEKLAIAVIDNGVDYNHPWLAERIRYTLDSGAVTGAGYDFLGNDSWPHPNLIDATLYSFGAQGLVDGKIDGPMEDPFAPILDLNNRFMDSLLAKIAASTILKSSLYGQKITKQSFSILAGHFLVNSELFPEDDWEEKRDEALADEEDAWKSYVSVSDLQDPAKLEILKEEAESIYQAEKKWLRPWYMDSASNFPNFDGEGNGKYAVYDFVGTYQYYQFSKVVKETLAEVEAEWKKATEQLFQFKYLRSTDKSGSRGDFEEKYFEKIGRAIYVQQFGYSYLDPALNYLEKSCPLYSSDELALLRDAVTDEAAKSDLVDSKIKDLFSLAKNVDNVITDKSTDWVSANDKKSAKGRLIQYDDIVQFISLVARNRGLHNFACNGFEPDTSRFWPLYQRDFESGENLLLSKSSKNTSHGTHVAGVIAAQDDNIEIVPIRIVTQQTEKHGADDQGIKTAYLDGLKTWLATPAVLQMIVEKYSDAFPALPTSADQQVDFLFNVFKGIFEAEFDNRRLDYLFFHEIQLAVEYVGKNKIKVANMSLGSKSERAVSDGSDVTPETVFNSVDFEYLKFKIGESIQKHARNTLFVIAAGNDGNWVDGSSRSALPCDISSPLLKEIPGGETLANNQVNNILCVGSIGPKGDLSPFTNILLTDTPMIFSLGESIDSTLKQTDCSGADTLFNKRFGQFVYPYLSIFDEGPNEMVVNLGLVSDNYATLDPDDQEKDRMEALSSLNDRLGDELTSLINVSKRHFCLRRYYTTGTMSGTSMATPGVAGFVGRWLLDKMQEFGLSEENLYTSADFTPQQIIQKVSDESPDFGSRVLRSKKIDKLESVTDLNPLSADLVSASKQLKPGTTSFMLIKK